MKKRIDRKKYGGQYVATASYNNRQIIAAGKNLTTVYRKAEEKGYKDPVINYIYQEGVVCIY